MRRQLLLELVEYFDNLGADRSKTEEYLFLQLHAELPYFQITTVHRDDLAQQGFDISNVTDEQMETIADKMAEACSEQVFWIDLDIIADYAGVPKKETNRYVLVEFPEETGYFEENDMGYPCFNSGDNGARYVPEEAYIEYFGHEPPPDSYFRAVRWPQSQEFFGNDDDSIAALCEPIVADEKALEDFGSSAIWVSLCLLNRKSMEEEKPTVYFYCDSGDFVHCNSCDKIMLLPTGADKCPACHREGALSWEDLNLQEATREELSALEKYELIVETAPEPSEYLSGEVMWEKTVEIIQANRPCNDYELELYKAEFANRPFPLKSVEELFYDFDAWQKQSGLVIEKITDANYWASI